MLVTNCTVDEQRVLASPSGPGKKAAGGRRKGKGGASGGGLGELEPGGSGSGSAPPDQEERFHPVSCAVCSTEASSL